MVDSGDILCYYGTGKLANLSILSYSTSHVTHQSWNNFSHIVAHICSTHVWSQPMSPIMFTAWKYCTGVSIVNINATQPMVCISYRRYSRHHIKFLSLDKIRRW